MSPDPAPAATRGYRYIEVRPVAGAIGAEIGGVDISRPLPGAAVEELRRAWLDYLVLFIPGQALTPQAQLDFARRFGEPMEYPQLKGLPEHPLITPVIKLEHERINFGGVWHSDTTYLERPPMASMLYALETPPQGGDTLFANQYLAYETLSEGMQRLLSHLKAVHSDRNVAGPQANRNAQRSTKVREDADWRETVSAHPVVVTHPETGRKLLYVNRSYTQGFEGMSAEESRPLLDYLLEHGHRPEFTCRFRWERGSIAFWDNRCCKHLAIHDAGPFRRVMRRTQIAGAPPV